MDEYSSSSFFFVLKFFELKIKLYIFSSLMMHSIFTLLKKVFCAIYKILTFRLKFNSIIVKNNS